MTTVFKTCPGCGVEKPVNAQHFFRNGKPGKFYGRCKICMGPENRKRIRKWYRANRLRVMANVSRWQAANPTKAAGHRLVHRYGISISDYLVLLKEQDGRCAICRKPAPSWGAGKRLHIDHDHHSRRKLKKDRIRGLLCAHCNVALGNFRDSIPLLQAAIRYLRRVK